MPTFEFTITAPATISARVSIEADTLEEAHEIALRPSFYEDPDNADFQLDEGNAVDDVYLPDPSDYEVTGEPAEEMEDEAEAPAP